MEAGAQPLHHRHAQPLPASKDLADAARCSQDRHHVGTGEAVLIHQVADEIGRTGSPARPLALLVGGDQTRLRLEPRNVGRLIRPPEPINERARARKLGIAINQDQGRIHHTVSASILSYWAWLPKSRTAWAPARYWMAASIVVALDVEYDPAGLSMLAFGYDAFTSSGFRHWARPTISSHASYCDRAALVPLWPPRSAR